MRRTSIRDIPNAEGGAAVSRYGRLFEVRDRDPVANRRWHRPVQAGEDNPSLVRRFGSLSPTAPGSTAFPGAIRRRHFMGSSKEGQATGQ